MFIFILLFWIILNGKITVEILAIGLVISALIMLFANKFLNYKISTEKKFWRNIGFAAEYLVVLLWEIIKANVVVLKILLTKGRKINPVIVHFDSPLKKEFLQVVLANSITLTPGTITVRMNENGYEVHCLDESLAEGLNSGVFVKMLKKMEEK